MLIIIGGKQNLSRTIHNRSRGTLSNTLTRSRKTIQDSLQYSLRFSIASFTFNIASAQPLSGRKPHCNW